MSVFSVTLIVLVLLTAYQMLPLEWKERLRRKKKKVLTVQPEKKAVPEVLVSVLAGAIVAFTVSTGLVMLVLENPAIHKIVALPMPLIVCGLVLVGTFMIPRIGSVFSLAVGVLAGIAVWKGFFPLQEYSMLLWEKLALPAEYITLPLPLWWHLSTLLFFALWFVSAKLISKRRTKGIYTIGAAFFIYMEVFLLAIYAWEHGVC